MQGSTKLDNVVTNYMLYQVKNIIKMVKPAHVIKSVSLPFQTVEFFKYHYRRVRGREFIELPSKRWNCTSEFWEDFKNHSGKSEKNKSSP